MTTTDQHDADTDDRRPDEVVLVTGFPAFSARRMVRKIGTADPGARIVLLVREADAAHARDFIATLPAGVPERVSAISGDVCHMDLGLAGAEYRDLAARVTTIHHLASVQYSGVEPHEARATNVEGTRGLLEFAAACGSLRRVCHWSTALVSGKRKGMVLEEELDEGQAFRNAFEETKFEGEKLAREAMRRLPVTVFRPGMIVGDSQTGEIDRLDGPYYLIVLIMNSPLGVRLPLPSRGTAPLHLVPIDYVIDAGYELSLDTRAAGKTFHLTDSNPLPARKLYEMVAELAQQKAPRGFIPGRLTRALLSTPGIDKLARGPLSFLESFDHQVFYNSRGATALLEPAGIRCPPVDAYLEALVRHVRDVQAAEKRPDRAPTDDFDALD